MNCAKITVSNGGSGFDGPDVFVANLGAVNSVKSVLGTDVIFPDPGSSVEYGGDGKRALPIGIAASAVNTPASESVTPVPKPVQNTSSTAIGNGHAVSVTFPLGVAGPTTLRTVTITEERVEATRSKKSRSKTRKHRGRKSGTTEALPTI